MDSSGGQKEEAPFLYRRCKLIWLCNGSLGEFGTPIKVPGTSNNSGTAVNNHLVATHSARIHLQPKEFQYQENFCLFLKFLHLMQEMME